MGLTLLTWRKSAVLIEQLRAKLASLGKPQPKVNHKKLLFLGEANKEIDRLRALVETVAAPATPALDALAPVAMTADAPPRPIIAAHRTGAEISNGLSRQTLNQLAAVFPELDASDKLTDVQLRERLEVAAFQSFLRFDGMTADADLANRHRRAIPDQAMHGFALTLRHMRQTRIDSILSASEQSAGHAAEPAAVKPNATAAGRPSGRQLKQIATILRVDLASGMTDAEVFTACEKAAFQNHLHFIGMRGEQELAGQYHQPDAAKVIGSTGAVHHLALQQKLIAATK